MSVNIRCREGAVLTATVLTTSAIPELRKLIEGLQQ